MPNSAMWTGGSVTVRSALPSLVTSTTVPVSAMAMFAPLMPTTASMNFWRREMRAWCWMASTVGSVPKTRAASSLVRWMAGAMMCEGRVPVSWTMRSPRSVSTTSIPSDSRYGLSSISSEAIDLTLVTTGRTPAPGACSAAAFQHSWPMMSRASAASAAKCTCPPTASSRSANWRASSGRRSRLARRLCLRSSRPLVKSKSAKPASRRPRIPVIADVSARCRFSSLSAWRTRPEKWSLLSGTRRLRRRFVDRFGYGGGAFHRRQAYGSDADDRPVFAAGLDHRVRMGQHRRPRQLLVAGRDLHRWTETVERSREHRRHQSVLARERRHGFERASRAAQMQLLGVAQQGVQLDQRDRRDRVLAQRLHRVGQPAELVAARPIEVAAEVLVGVAILQVTGELARHRQPSVAEPRLIGPDRGEQSPHLVAQLAADPVGVDESAVARVAIREQSLQRAGGMSTQVGQRMAPRRVEIRHRQRSIPR